MSDPNAKPSNDEGGTQPSGSPPNFPQTSSTGSNIGNSTNPSLSHAQSPGNSDSSSGGNVENTDAVLSSAGDSSSASEQLAQLLGLHIPIPSYTPPDGPPEELEFKPSSKVEIEAFQLPQRSPPPDNESLTEIYQRQVAQRPPQSESEVDFRPAPRPTPVPAPTQIPASLSELAETQLPKKGLGDSVNVLQDILVRPELKEFRGRLESLEDHTAKLDSAQKNLGAQMGDLRQEIDQAIAQVINQLVDERFAQLETDWRSRIDLYFQESFQGLFTEYFERHIEQRWPKLVGRLAQQLAGQMNRINGRLDLLESRVQEMSTTLDTTVRSLRDISPDFEAGVRIGEVEKRLKGLTQNLASLAGGLGADSLAAYSELQKMMAEDGITEETNQLSEPVSPEETMVQLEEVEHNLGQLGNGIQELNEEIDRHEEPLPDSMGAGNRLKKIEERLKQLTFALVAIVQILQQRPEQWAQDPELGDRLRFVEQELGMLSDQVTYLSQSLPEAPEEPEMVSSSLSIRVKGVDPRWNASQQWGDEEDAVLEEDNVE
ncbi:MAG: hypothetical protein ACFCA4_07945 [Cyanophyceae cyanobacterium]